MRLITASCGGQVSLELGGKSPTVVDEKVDLSIAAKRIVQGKFANAGQTCIAPDYILAHANIVDHLVAALAAEIKEIAFREILVFSSCQKPFGNY